VLETVGFPHGRDRLTAHQDFKHLASPPLGTFSHEANHSKNLVLGARPNRLILLSALRSVQAFGKEWLTEREWRGPLACYTEAGGRISRLETARRHFR
jgi:hypothetical protein